MKNNKRLLRVSRLLTAGVMLSGGFSYGQQSDMLGDSLIHKKINGLAGVQDARKVITSISSLDSETIEKNSVLAFGNALYGRLPGLHVVQGTGELGKAYPSLYIRGMHSFTGTNSPIILVDGFERDFNTLSVDEIESVAVLKDAAATALFGMDGANGIILVTTKRGLDAKTRVGVKAEFGLQSPTRLPEFYGSYDYASFYNMAERNDGKNTVSYSDEKLTGYLAGTDGILYPDVDWLSESIRETTPTQNYVVDLRGGNKTAKFYVNLGYARGEGLFKEFGNKPYEANNKLDRINFRSNIDVNVTKYLSMSVDIAGRLENVNSPLNSSTNIWNNLYTYHPNVAPVYVTGNSWGGTNSYRNNPVAYINDAGYRRTHRRLLQTNLQLNYDLSRWVKNLNIGVRGAFDNFYSVDNGYSKIFGVQEALGYDEQEGKYILSDLYGINSPLSSFGPSEEQEIRSNNLEVYLNHHIAWGNHHLSSRLMAHRDSYETYLSSKDLSSTPDRRVMFGANVNYDYNGTYLLNVAASYGGGENFMRGKRFGFFPSVAAGWVLSNESFMQEADWVSFLKLRASTGLVGNQSVGGTPFGYRILYSGAGGGWGAGVNNGGINGGYMEAALGNPDLTWEKALKTDVGLDVTLWNHLDLMFNYFYEYRYDILNSGDILTPGYIGASFGYINYGKVGGSGFESSIGYHNKTKDWSYNANLNVAYQTNKILRKRETRQLYDYLYTQGRPIGQRFGYICEGFYSEDDVKNREVKQTFGAVIPGSLKYKDVNGDGVVDTHDRVAIGDNQTIPDWELGFNLGVKYKGIYLDANFQACLGRSVDLRNTAPYATSPLYYDRNVSKWIKQPWTAEAAADPRLASKIDFPSLSIENAGNNFQTSTFFLRNGDFLRLRSLEVGYEFPVNILRAVYMQNARIYLRGMNLFTLDHLDGFFDPEVLEGYPVQKSYNIGVALTF